AGLLADVGMVLARQPAIGGLDLRLAGIGLHAQNTVVILELHARSTTTARVRAVEVYRCADARSVSGRRTDLDPPRRGLRALGDDDLQHAIAAIGGHALRVGAVGQREAAVETAVAALDAREALGLGGRLACALALDREDALVHLHLDVLRVDARQVGVDHEAAALLTDVDRRYPLRGDHGRGVGVLLAEEAVEHLLDLIMQRQFGGALAVTDDTHLCTPGLPGRRQGRHARDVGTPA